MRPKIICHMISSVDGRLLTDRFTQPFDGKKADDVISQYFPISERLDGQAWIVGRNTVQEFSVKGTFDYEKYPPASSHKTHIGKRDSKVSAIVVDTKGKALYESDNLDGDNIIAVLGEKVSEEYLSLLRERGISYVFSGPEGKDLAKAMESLGSEFGMDKVLLEGGGIINGSFLKAGLIDELSLMIYPGIDGLAGMPSIFEYMGKKTEVPAKGQSMELVSMEKLEDGVVWLYYKFHKS